MKSKLIMVGLMIILVLSLMACSSPSPGSVSWEVPIENFMNQQHISDQIEVPAGDTLTVILGSNPTTGFKWELTSITDQSVLQQDGEPEFVPPEEAIPGAGGKEVWTFQALKKGTSTVSMEYSRPWEGGEKGEWTYTLTVAVK